MNVLYQINHGFKLQLARHFRAHVQVDPGLMPDRQITRLLNRVGKPTGQGNGWTEARVRSFRNYSHIAVYGKGEWAERGEIALETAAEIIGAAKMTTLHMIRRGDIKGRQLCKGAL